MKHPNQLYVERKPGENVREYFARFADITGYYPCQAAFFRGYKPAVIKHNNRNWNQVSAFLADVGRDHFMCYPEHGGKLYCFENDSDAVMFKLTCF